jgi:predicted hydrolase (HD superfamily)
VRKKWNQKGFAAGASREIIEAGAKMLSIEIEELVSDAISGMQEVTAEIGL